MHSSYVSYDLWRLCSLSPSCVNGITNKTRASLQNTYITLLMIPLSPGFQVFIGTFKYKVDLFDLVKAFWQLWWLLSSFECAECNVPQELTFDIFITLCSMQRTIIVVMPCQVFVCREMETANWHIGVLGKLYIGRSSRSVRICIV